MRSDDCVQPSLNGKIINVPKRLIQSTVSRSGLFGNYINQRRANVETGPDLSRAGNGHRSCFRPCDTFAWPGTDAGRSVRCFRQWSGVPVTYNCARSAHGRPPRPCSGFRFRFAGSRSWRTGVYLDIGSNTSLSCGSTRRPSSEPWSWRGMYRATGAPSLYSAAACTSSTTAYIAANRSSHPGLWRPVGRSCYAFPSGGHTYRWWLSWPQGPSTPPSAPWRSRERYQTQPPLLMPGRRYRSSGWEWVTEAPSSRPAIGRCRPPAPEPRIWAFAPSLKPRQRAQWPSASAARATPGLQATSTV